VGFGFLMLFVSWTGIYYILRRKEFPKLFLKVVFYMTFSGWVATIAGWYVTEIGRQPYLVYGLLKTKDAVTTTPSAHIAFSLSLYLVVYALLLTAFITTIFYMAVKNKDKEEIDPKTGQRRSIIIGA
jgi:cytochrome d ubiquinol oxidase subunit I